MEDHYENFSEPTTHLTDLVPITEIALYGEGEMRLDLHEGKLRLVSTVACSLRRGPPHRLVVNHGEQRGVHAQQTMEGVYAKVGHVDEKVERAECELFPTMEAVEKALLPLLSSPSDVTSTKLCEWLLVGENLNLSLVETRNLGNLVLHNRSFKHRSLRLTSVDDSRSLEMDPYVRHSAYVRPCLRMYTVDNVYVQGPNGTFITLRECLEPTPPPPPEEQINFEDYSDVRKHHSLYVSYIETCDLPWSKIDPLIRNTFTKLEEMIVASQEVAKARLDDPRGLENVTGAVLNELTLDG
jgi:hypothetical protein